MSRLWIFHVSDDDEAQFADFPPSALLESMFSDSNCYIEVTDGAEELLDLIRHHGTDKLPEIKYCHHRWRQAITTPHRQCVLVDFYCQRCGEIMRQTLA